MKPGSCIDSKLHQTEEYRLVDEVLLYDTEGEEITIRVTKNGRVYPNGGAVVEAMTLTVNKETVTMNEEDVPLIIDMMERMLQTRCDIKRVEPIGR